MLAVMCSHTHCLGIGEIASYVSKHAVTMFTQDELPEALLGAVRLQNLDLSKAGILDLATGKITRRS